MKPHLSAFTRQARLPILAFWSVLALVLFLFTPALADVADYSSQGFLPRTAPSYQAQVLLEAVTTARSGATSLIVTLSRSGGLRPDDGLAGQDLVRRIQEAGPGLGLQSLLHPWLSEQHRSRLVSPDGSCALVVLGLEELAWAKTMPGHVDRLRALARTVAAAHPGLDIHVTGEAAFSADEHHLVRQSMDLITLITVFVILLVLTLIFRSPVTPLLPLSVIGLSFLISRSLIAAASLAGLKVSAYTETFLIAVLFGMGTDYCLLLIARFREELGRGLDAPAALDRAIRLAMPAIVSSGATTATGFLAMGLAAFGLYNSTGPAVAIGVVITVLMVMTLTPALMSWFGTRIFWPRPVAVHSVQNHGIWPRLALVISRRPGLVLLAVLALFVLPLAGYPFMARSFDQISEMPDSADSRQGFDRIKQAFQAGELMPLKLVVESPRDIWGPKALPELDRLALSLARQPGIRSVRTATRPSGERVDTLDRPAGAAPVDLDRPLVLPKIMIAGNPRLKEAMETYISPDGRTVYLDVILDGEPYVLAAMDQVARVRQVAAETLAGGPLDGAKVAVAGATAMFADVRDLTQADFVTVMAFMLAGVFVILVLLLRSLVAPLYLLGTILVSYLSTMGLCYWVFQVLLGWEGVNWAVGFFTFCVLVALGVDYNIFLMSRVREEYRPGGNAAAVRAAMVGTGKIITSCGIIMAGTFAAMMVSPMRSIQEVGFASVAGLLIDTFVIRSIMVPALAFLAGEANWWPRRRRKPAGS